MLFVATGDEDGMGAYEELVAMLAVTLPLSLVGLKLMDFSNLRSSKWSSTKKELVSIAWSAVKELKLGSHNGYIYIW